MSQTLRKEGLTVRVSVRAWSGRIGEDEPFDTTLSLERVTDKDGEEILYIVADGKQLWVEADNFASAVASIIKPRNDPTP
jgi:hypothetical protein